ncbi:MAG TPA: universal stress protein [Dehalococcoidia bacterium]
MRLLIPLDQTPHAETVLEVVARTILPAVDEAHLLVVANLEDVQTERLVPPSERPGRYSVFPGIFPLYGPMDADGEEEGAGGEPSPERITREDLERNVEHYLVDAAARLGGGVRCTPAVVESEKPEQAIVDYARQHGVDMIAMATHGRAGLARAVRGSVTDAVIRSGVAPVLVCHPAGDG